MPLQFPRIFLLPTHLQAEEQHELEDKIESLTYDINEAEVVLGNITRRERALFELRRAKLETIPLAQQETACPSESQEPIPEEPSNPPRPKRRRSSGSPEKNGNIVRVVKLAWLKDSLEKDEVLPVGPYTLYEGQRALQEASSNIAKGSSSSGILQRALNDQLENLASQSSPKRTRHGRRSDMFSSQPRSQKPPSLSRETTSEHEAVLPLVPEFLHTVYSCQRPNPVNSPNDEFIELLKQVRTIRLLRGDQVGVRAYSTSIAALAAYPFLLKTSQEVARLPGCGARIAELYQQWKGTGHLSEIERAESDTMVSVLKLFYDIWGVGDTTAREFYRKGWRDLDDIVEHGWASLTRAQQIGIKYYNELNLKIPREEAERIGTAVLDHARKYDAGFEMILVGGFRRGKKECGDVDILLSHRDNAMTMDVVGKIVMSLEKAHVITHTLTLSTKNSERGQAPLPWRGEGIRGSGFDTLDKAMVVWQEAGREGAPHRRVDIIVSPWKTVGCAMLGWSGATTFERDLRRYCKDEKGWKFDSSGIRNRADGAWVDLEGSSRGDEAPDMETAERRVFEGLGLEWRRPDERCTG